MVGLLLVLVAICAARALSLSSRQQTFEAVKPVELDAPEVMAQRLSRALTLQTVSRAEPPFVDDAPFAALRAHLEESFPLVHRTLQRQVINGNSLLYTWQGSDPGLKAVLFIAHQDVVPADEATLRDWMHPPFGGVIADGFIWGRGALDDKGRLFAQLEAAEALLRSGFAPNRTVYFGFGHDEEVGGSAGARLIAAELSARRAQLEFLVDEGLPITVGVLAGVKAPVATIGIAEKGVLDVELTVQGEGGHSSTPPPNTAAGVLAAAVAKLEANPFPTRGGLHIDLLGEFAGPHMPFASRVAFANLWLLRPLVHRQLQSRPGTAALTRTTLAVTMLSGSTRSNVLPRQAKAVVNVRMLPGDTEASVLARFTEVINDERVKVAAVGELKKESSTPASADSRGFKALARATREVRPDALVVPMLVVGTTDSPHYRALTTHAFRHSPFVYSADDIKRLHGTNERLRVEDYVTSVFYFQRLLQHAAGP